MLLKALASKRQNITTKLLLKKVLLIGSQCLLDCARNANLFLRRLIKSDELLLGPWLAT